MPTGQNANRTKCQPRLAFCPGLFFHGWHFVRTNFLVGILSGPSHLNPWRSIKDDHLLQLGKPTQCIFGNVKGVEAACFRKEEVQVSWCRGQIGDVIATKA